MLIPAWRALWRTWRPRWEPSRSCRALLSGTGIGSSWWRPLGYVLGLSYCAIPTPRKPLVSIRRSGSSRINDKAPGAQSSRLSDVRKSLRFSSLGLFLLLSWESFCLLFKHHSCPVMSHREEIGQLFTATKEELVILCAMGRLERYSPDLKRSKWFYVPWKGSLGVQEILTLWVPF